MLSDLRTNVAAQHDKKGKKRRIELLDSLFRDSHQCLWATRMSTEHMLPVASMLDAAGYETIEIMGLSQHDIAVTVYNQNPLERLRLLRERITTTPIRSIVRSNLLNKFAPVSNDLTDLYIERHVTNGARDVLFLESLHDWDIIEQGVKTVKRLGAKVTIAMVYNLAPGYDADYYTMVARQAISQLKPDRMVFADAGGILTQEQLRKILPAIREAVGDMPLEFNTHCLTGVGPLLAIEAAVLGADTIYTAVEPMANGYSLPGGQMVARNLREIGFDVRVDDRAIETVQKYFQTVAEQEGQPIGVPAEYSPRQYQSQMAGGALSNLKSQMEAAGIGDKLPQVMEEISRIRLELGSPIMATPFPAIVAAQAVMNVVHGERYRMVPSEVKKYICGYYGVPRIPVDQEVVDRVMANGPRDIASVPPEIPPLVPKLRKLYPNANDDELLLRFMFDDKKNDGLKPTEVKDNLSVQSPIVDLVEGLARRKRKTRVHLTGINLSFSVG